MSQGCTHPSPPMVAPAPPCGSVDLWVCGQWSAGVFSLIFHAKLFNGFACNGFSEWFFSVFSMIFNDRRIMV